MKKLNLLTLLLVTLCTLSLTSCKDDDDDNNVSPRTAMLTDGEWTGEGIYVRPPFLPLTNITTLLRALGENELADELDITTTKFDFKRDGTFSATKDGVTQTGNWRFTDDEQQIIISGNDLILTGENNEATFSILILTATQFNLEINVTEMGYDPADFQGINKFELRLVRP